METPIYLYIFIFRRKLQKKKKTLVRILSIEVSTRIKKNTFLFQPTILFQSRALKLAREINKTLMHSDFHLADIIHTGNGRLLFFHSNECR